MKNLILEDQLTDEEELHDDIWENGRDLSEVAGTSEMHASLPDTSENLDNQYLPSKIVKVYKQLGKVTHLHLPKWRKKNKK